MIKLKQTGQLIFLSDFKSFNQNLNIWWPLNQIANI